MLAGGEHRGDELTEGHYADLLAKYPVKFWWFQKHGYQPHIWQALFHGASLSHGYDETEKLTRFRHLVAGRRGGKTLSAAWEVLFYALHPSEFHRDAHGIESDRALWIWILAKDYPTGYPSLQTLLEVMGQVGLVKGRDYHYNKTERRIEFIESGTVVQFKTADDPQSLRGAGLDILWIDEAAFVEKVEAWHVVFPALADKQGLVVTTTTPHGKNWFWEEFFAGKALEDQHQFRVQYTSIDNPYFPREQWQYALEHYHPIYFKQEFLAAFDAMAGVALQGEWLHYWILGRPDPQTGDMSLKPYLDEATGRYNLRIFLGIDPAVSIADDADDFAMAVIGLDEEKGQAFLLDFWLGHIAFPEQLDKIHEWHLKWRPEQMGIESNAFQAALAQMSSRMDGFPPVVPVFSKGKKNERIMRMSPLFKIGKVRIAYDHRDFITQWVNFDPLKKNQRDDLLDAVEIALGVAGVLLPLTPHKDLLTPDIPHQKTPGQLAREQIAAIRAGANRPYDPDLGSEA